MSVQLGLFTGEPIKIKHKRIHYKIATYHKSYSNDITDEGFIKDDIALWGRMQEVYKQIANYFCKMHPKEIEEIDGIIRVWHEEYEREIYQYKGKAFKGQHFKVATAEVIGSEDMRADKRLKLHEDVLKMLRNGKDLQCIKDYCQNEIRRDKE